MVLKLRNIKDAINLKGKQVNINLFLNVPSELTSSSVCGSEFQQSTDLLKMMMKNNWDY